MPGTTQTNVSQAERIAIAAAKAREARDAYARRDLANLNEVLARANNDVVAEVKKLGDIADPTPNQTLRLARLNEIKGGIDKITTDLKKNLTAFAPDTAGEAMQLGMRDATIDLGVRIPSYQALSLDRRGHLAATVFGLIDRSAIDFVTRFRLDLLGDVSAQLNREIKLRVASGLVAGKSIPNIVRDLGTVITDPEGFRATGKTVFKSTQLRLTTIARSETNRAHNQGRLKFYDSVGVRRVKWLADADPCPICQALHGVEYDIDKVPALPAHPNCECTITAAGTSRACDLTLGKASAGRRTFIFMMRAVADGAGPLPAATDAQGPCILTPDQVESFAAGEKPEKPADPLAPYKADIQAGNYANLPITALRELGKSRGISVHRSKLELIKLLDQSVPGVDHSHLAGKALSEKLGHYGISKVRSKAELVKLLTDYDAAKAAAVKHAAETTPHFAGMTVKQLQDEAKAAGISVAKTKTQLVKELEKAEPNPAIPHFMRKGKDLNLKLKQHHIARLKNKSQLITELNQAYNVGSDAAKVAQAAAQHRAVLQTAIDEVIVPDEVGDWQAFLKSYRKATKVAEQKAPLIPGAEADSMLQSLKIKKATWDQKVGNLTTIELKKIAKDTKIHHWQWHNKSDLVTKLTSTDADEIAKANATVEARWQAWKAKQKVTPAPKQEGPVVVPETKLPPKDPTKLTPASAPFAEVDAAWADRAAAGRFKNRTSASNLGGAHRKYVYDDDQGRPWLFKPVSEDFRAYGDEAAYKIGRLVDPDAIEVRVVKLDGQLGSIQPIRRDLAAKKDLSGLRPVELTATEHEQIQREHVIDWLISNHDAHDANFLRGKNGHLYGIDKGQLFKHLGEDRLALDYHPNARFGAKEPFYNTLMRAYADKTIDLDLHATLKYIERVEAIGDDEYLDLIRPYAERRFRGKAARAEAFMQQTLARKKNLRQDFERYYDSLAKKRGLKGFTFVDEAPAPRATLEAFEESLIDDAAKARWQGKSLPMDEDQIEDQNALVFEQVVRKGGKVTGRQTVVTLKVRPQAEKKLLETIKPHLKPGARELPRVGDALAEDEFYEPILKAVKTVNHHFGDKDFNQTTLDQATALRTKLRQLAKDGEDEVRRMATEYLERLNEIEQTVELVRAGKPTEKLGKFVQYTRKAATATEKGATVPFRVRDGNIRLQKRTNRQGEVIWDGETQTLQQAFDTGGIDSGYQYEIEFDDGITAIYRPWKENANTYAFGGELEVRVEAGLSNEAVSRAIESIERLGIKASAASVEDAEIMYLQKQAYILDIDRTPRFKEALKAAKKEKTKQAQVRALRQFWNTELGVEDVTKIEGYDPFGTFQLGTAGKASDAGRRLQYRFDLTDADLDRELGDKALFHRLTNDRDLGAFIEEALKHNGAMVSTAEKLRIGVPPGGMSPGADVKTGGASYFFTRIRSRPSTTHKGEVGLYFKKRLLRRMDAISYDRDRYGRVTGTITRKHRFSRPDQWNEISRQRGRDETIFKYTVTIPDNIDVIVVKSDAERQRVVSAFKKHDYARLPDGRKIEDIVLVR